MERFLYAKNDPKRSALFQMRQVFDHFMGKLAPDEEVRKSPFWTKKTGEKPDGVTRRERLQFAAHRCITNDSGRTALLESVDETLRSYDRLQEAHKRGALSIDKANEAFKANDSILRRWIDSANPWPPK